MTEQDNIQAVQKWVEAINAHDIGQLEQYRGPGYTFEAPAFPGPVGVDQDVVFTRGLFEAFPDMHIDVKETIVQGDCVVINCTVTGTNDGPLALPSGETVPATGKKVATPVSNTFEVAGGKISRNSLYYDQVGLMAQLGLMPKT